ncbi:MAG: hypothetical protein H5T99_01735, partial [Moorella sp. (in: Bacteria)]|nr:hypothetical protein [Moorella sp. (in: firmicutes)]
MNSRPLVIFTCFFLAGVLLAAPLQVAPPIAAAACGLFFLLAVAGYLCAWRNNRWVICLLFLATGFAWARLAYAQINPALFKYCGHYVTIEGVVS